MSPRKRIKRKILPNVRATVDRFLMATLRCCALFRFARCIGLLFIYKKVILLIDKLDKRQHKWLIKKSRYINFQPGVGHVYKNYGEHYFIGTRDEMYKYLNSNLSNDSATLVY